ncbi:MAG TPA: transglycosylase SLT domain-containing protein [Candidatus Binatia bacterium]|jgi:soluble lytic murein transglycosylase
MRKQPTFWLAVFVLFFSSTSHSQDPTPRELFAKGYALYSGGDTRQAEEYLIRTLDRGFILEDYSLHLLAQIAVNAGNPQATRQYYGQLQQKFPDSIWLPHADLQLTRFALADKNYAKVIELGRALRSLRAKREIADEAAYLIAQAYEGNGDWKQAYAGYQELRRSSPLSAWDAPARKAVAALRDKFPDQFQPATQEAQLAEADLLTKEQAYGDGEKIYRKLLDQTPTGNFRARALSGLGNLYRLQRKRDEAIPVYTEIVQSFPESAEAPPALHQLAQIYWNRDDDAKALEYFKLMRDRYSKSPYADFAANASARIYESAGKTDDALAAYQALAKHGTEAQWREEGAWRAAWIYYFRKDDYNANAGFKRLAASKDANKYRLAAIYWQARTAGRMQQIEDAKRLYLIILNDGEESYYKAAATTRLAALGAAPEEKKFDAAPPEAKSAALTSAQSFHLLRAQELTEISLQTLAVAELDEVRSLSSEDTGTRLLLLKEYGRSGAYHRVVTLSNQSPLTRYGDELLRYRYPLAYWDTVQKVAKESGMDPYLVVSLMRQESLFDPRALSPAAAHGLMQMLHSTATRTAARLKLAAPTREKLFDPELNLKLGVHHLKELLQRFSNSNVKAIAAYNAGAEAVSRWESRYAGAEDDEFVERIPYTETQLYVKLVLRNVRVYKKLYSEQK